MCTKYSSQIYHIPANILLSAKYRIADLSFKEFQKSSSRNSEVKFKEFSPECKAAIFENMWIVKLCN